MTNILSVENLDIFYDKFHGNKNSINSLNQKDIVVICGPSGSGKSTLIRSIAGLEKYKTGKILVNNEVRMKIYSYEKKYFCYGFSAV